MKYPDDSCPCLRRDDPPPYCVLWRAGKVRRRSGDKLRTGALRMLVDNDLQIR
jgi:hypothetical protein